MKQKITDVNEVIKAIHKAKLENRGESIGYLGNIVTLWERLAEE